MVIYGKTFLDTMPTVQSVKQKLDLKTEQPEEEYVPGGGSFADALKESWEAGSQLSAESKELTAQMLTGQLDDFPGYLVAGEKSSLMFEYNLSVRTKLLDAYSEIMKTGI